MIGKLIYFVILVLLQPFRCFSQFKKDVEQAYILYNKARLSEASGHLDSAADYVKRSIRLNREDGIIRDYAQAVYLKCGRYSDFIEDVTDYYSKNTMPEEVDRIFGVVNDSATVADAKKSNEIRKFISGYEDKKKINRQKVKVNNELKQILDNCMAIDQFARNPDWLTKDDSIFYGRLIRVADSTNMEVVASYIKKNGFPGSVELDGITLTSNFITLLLHFLEYKNLPVCKYIDSSVQNAVHNGMFPARYYIFCLDNRMALLESKQLYGTWMSGSTDTITKKKIRVHYFKIDDIEHVDERRRKWLLLTLYEESLVDPIIRLPENYHRK